MPPERRNAEDAGEWLRRARSNLARVKAGRTHPEILYEDLCFDAQQAAEKAIKALLVHRRVAFPKTHALVELLTLVDRQGLPVPEDIRQAAILTDYAVESRYPGLTEPVSATEHETAADLAERVVRWAEELIGGPPDRS